MDFTKRRGQLQHGGGRLTSVHLTSPLQPTYLHAWDVGLAANQSASYLYYIRFAWTFFALLLLLFSVSYSVYFIVPSRNFLIIVQ